MSLAAQHEKRNTNQAIRHFPCLLLHLQIGTIRPMYYYMCKMYLTGPVNMRRNLLLNLWSLYYVLFFCTEEEEAPSTGNHQLFRNSQQKKSAKSKQQEQKSTGTEKNFEMGLTVLCNAVNFYVCTH